MTLRLLFVLATEHTLLLMFSNIRRQILFPGNLHDDTFNCPRCLKLPACFSITGVYFDLIRPGFHYMANATTTTQKQSDYRIEQSSFTLIALF